MYKKGQSTAVAWLLGLFGLFAIAIMFIVFNQVMVNYIEPTSQTIMDTSPYINETLRAELTASNDKYLAFWTSVPFIMVFLIVLFIIMSSVFNNGGNQYGQ